MADTKHQQKLQKILADLNSDDSKKISKALKSLEVHGDSSVIKPLAKRLLQGVSETNESEIIELLSSLKDTSSVVEIMDVLGDSEFRPIRQKILTSVWNTKVDFSNYIDEFVEIAVNGNFMEALDCLTIIENLEGPFMEENILECQLHLKSYMESNAKDQQKEYLLSEIAIKLKDFNENLED